MKKRDRDRSAVDKAAVQEKRIRASPGLEKSYTCYRWRRMEFFGYFVCYMGLAFGIGWMFYQNIIGMIPVAMVVVPVGLKRKKNELLEKKKKKLTAEFADCIRLVSGGLAAGYAMENAWLNAQQDLEKMYGKEADMCKELRAMNAGVKVNKPIESLLLDFAARSGLEDVDSFCQVLSFAKRSGGNMSKIIGNTVQKISDKQDVMREIETVMSAKRLEQRIMNVIPLVLIAYVGLSSPDFIEPLYHNLFGQIVMSICLLVYGGAFLLSERIIRIEV